MAESGWLADLQQTVYPHKWSPVSRRSNAGQRKFGCDILPLCHATNHCHCHQWHIRKVLRSNVLQGCLNLRTGMSEAFSWAVLNIEWQHLFQLQELVIHELCECLQSCLLMRSSAWIMLIPCVHQASCMHYPSCFSSQCFLLISLSLGPMLTAGRSAAYIMWILFVYEVSCINYLSPVVSFYCLHNPRASSACVHSLHSEV